MGKQATTGVTSGYTAGELVKLDRLRGSMPRAEFQRRRTMGTYVEPVPATPAPPKPPVAKVYDHLGVSITDPGPADVERLLEFGAWARAGIEECWDLTQFEAFLVEAEKQGLHVLGCIQPCPPRYVISPVPPAILPTAWMAARYTQFGGFAARVADLGVKAVEAGNELNNRGFNDASLAAGPLATTAVTLANAVAAAVHKSHPSVPVITNGWAPAGAGPSVLYPQNALAAMLKLGGLTDIEGFGYHPYEMSMLPSQSTDNPAWNACWWLRAAWMSIVAYGGSKPLWLTEFGKHGSDGDQETWLRDYFTAFTAHRAAGVQIENVFWHTLYEGQSTVNAAEATMGLLRANGSAWVDKPAAKALREIGAQPW